MTDLAPDTAPAPAPESEPASAPESEPTPAPDTGEQSTPDSGGDGGFAVAVEAVLDGDLPEGVDRFERSYVEKIRSEAARYRTEYKPFKEAFEGYDESDREAVLSLAKELLEDPDAAARRMLSAAKDIAGDRFDEWLNPKEPEYLTPEALEQQLAAREEKARQAAEVAAIQQEASSLGYTEGTPEHVQLFWYAANETKGDIKAAHEKLQAQRQAIIDEYVASVKEKGDRFPVTPTNVQGTPTGTAIAEGEPKTFAEAAARARARLSAAP